MLKVLIVGATGGLGQVLALEALGRGHEVSVLVRSKDKLVTLLGKDMDRLAQVHVGDAADVATAQKACDGVDVVLSGSGANAPVASSLAKACHASGVRKLVYVAGASNVLADDGVTLNYKNYLNTWAGAERAYVAHQACIDAIRATGINYVVFCPGFMRSVGKQSTPPVKVRINRPSGNFVSYEDAAVVMLNAAEKSDWDGQLITAATAQ